jgi:tetratricopeptide (TPR) repeat protein
LLAGAPSESARADEGDVEPARLEVKHVDDQDRVRIEAGPGPENRVKLVPFPEDLEEQPAAEPREEPPARKPPERTEPAPPRRTIGRLPAANLAPQSDFRPRFKQPAVRHAQHFEPIDSTRQDGATQTWSAGESATPARAGQASQAAAQSSAGKALVEQAFAQSKTATTDSHYTDIIELCRRAGKEGLKPSHDEYAKRLMSWAYNRRGEARAAEARDKEALADFEAAVELNPSSWRAIHNRGVSYAALGRTNEAVADFDRTIALNARYPNAYFNRGELRYSQGHFQEAIHDYTAAISIGPADAVMHNSRGHALYRLKRFGEALSDYGKALDLEPNNAAALVNRGDAYSDLGRYAVAAADYRAAITADPKMARGYQAAAWLMATCPDAHYRNEKLAIESATQAIQLDGDDFRNLETLAAAQASAGKFAEAKATQEKAIAKAPSSELVAAEKRMALYQRDLAFREQSPQQMIAASEERMQAAPQKSKKKYPVARASAELPDGPQAVTYPENQAAPPRRSHAPRSFWPPKSAGGQPRGQRPRMLPKMPTHPLGRN